MIIFLTILCIILAIALGVAILFLYRIGVVVLNITEEIAECLDILDDSYRKIAEILKTPVMMDDPFVRGVVDEIKKSKNAILVVANKLTSDWQKIRDTESDEEEDDEE